MRFTLLSFLPLLPCALWVADRYAAWSVSPLERMLRARMAELSRAPAPEPENAGVLLAASIALLLGVGFVCQAFWTGGILGTLASSGREGRASFGGACRAGLAKAPGMVGLHLWAFLRLLPWFLLFIIPGIWKGVAWSLAAPAWVSGYARTPEEALALSDRATRGRRWHLFGFLFLIWLLGHVIEQALSPSDAMKKAMGLQATFVVLGVVAIANALLGAVQLLGLWLAWSDAIAPREPGPGRVPSEGRDLR